jgi:dUTP pyrophosphatase
MEPMPFQCDHCDRGFKTQQALIAHSRAHRTKDEAAGSTIVVDSEMLREMITDLTAKYVHEPMPLPHNLPIPVDEILNPAPVTVRIKQLSHARGLPEVRRATTGSAAVDLYAAVDKPICLAANTRAHPPIPTGIAVEIPPGYVGKVVPRSGLANNNGISIVNTPGIIDSDYRGEIKVILINHSHAKFWVHRGDRIAQILIERALPVEFEYVDELSETARGNGGFGSTGVN